MAVVYVFNISEELSYKMKREITIHSNLKDSIIGIDDCIRFDRWIYRSEGN